MKPLRAWAWRLAGLFRRDRSDRELAAEIDSNLQLHIDDNLRAGMDPAQARRDALLKLGGLTPTMQIYRERTTVPFIEHLLQDVRFSIRQLRQNLGFTSTAILMLALGMCASVAIFAFVDAALVKPLPYRDPARLVGVYEQHPPQYSRSNLSYPDYLDWKRMNTVFTSLEAYSESGFIVTTPAGAEPAHAGRVSAGFFRTLGVTPALGRDFYMGEDLPGAPRTVMLSNATWRNRYSARPDIVGQTVTLDSIPYVVIGVLPAQFQFALLGQAEYWVMLHSTGSCALRRSCHNLYGVARLKDGVSLQSALADTKLIARQLEEQYPENHGQGANVLPLTEVISGDVRLILLVLLGGAGLLLLIACVNVASLLLVRSESRKREMAVRSALGASRARLIGQFVTEGLVLVAAGSTLGLVAAAWTMQLLTRLIPAGMLARMPFLQGIGLNVRVSAFACAIALLAVLLFAVTPSLRLSFASMRDGLAEGSRGSAGNTWRRLGSRLVVLELATAMVLLVGAGLLGQSLFRLLHVNLGFEPDHVATLTIATPDASYGKDPQAVALGRLIVSRVSSLPGVKSAGITSLLPVSYNGNTDWIRFVGKPFHGEHNEVNERDVSADYLKTLQVRLIRGRNLSDTDDLTHPRVAVINQALARKYYSDEDPIGKQFADDGLSPNSVRTIVGIVDDMREGDLDSDIWPAEYLSANQSPNNYYALVVRTSQDEQSILPALAATIRQVDPGIVTLDPTIMRDRIADSSAAYLHRSAAWLVSGFAAMALLLGVVGLYGVIAYSVSQRTREIGVRIALGAERGAVCRLILKEAGWLTAVGIFAGMAGALAATTLMRKLLFGIQSWDVPTLIGVAAVLGVAALLASYIPARRAASVNPMDALRAE
jgi:macrolide transport system ATP-binding/permease protein